MPPAAFVGSGIDFLLRGMELETLVACGCQACVQHTIRDAADLGYTVILVSDASFSSPGNDAEHERTLRTFGQSLGTVTLTAETLAALEAIQTPVLVR